MNEIKLDDKDFVLLDELRKNAKQSVFQLAKKTAIPPTTIHNRLKKLRENKIIKGYTVLIDREKIGQNLCALIFIYLDNNLLEPASKEGGLAKQLAKHACVDEVFEMAGTIDVVVKVYGTDIKDITEFVINKIRQIKGVAKTETHVALSEKRRQ